MTTDTVYRLTTTAAYVQSNPHEVSPSETELLHGEPFFVREIEDAWALGDASLSGCSGWVPLRVLACEPQDPTHRVTVPKLSVHADASAKSTVIDYLPLGSRLIVLGRKKEFLRIAQGHVWNYGTGLLHSKTPDWVSVAEQFVDAQYHWGGRRHEGIDCSGLVNIALLSIGVTVPHQASRIETLIGSAADPTTDGYQRGDLVFWKGHVGIMVDQRRLIHATADPSINAVIIEVLADVVARRLGRGQGPVTSVKRLVK